MFENSDKKVIVKNVCSEVVANNLCIGCGVCAAVCPKRNLEIRFNEYGENNAFETGAGCGEKCNLCLKVCPFYDNEENEDTLGKKLFADIPDIKHTPETGYYWESFVGYSKINGHRENGASGGLATWTMETLLNENLVDHVACVSPNDDQEKLFKFKICNTPEEVRKCSRSCYYPVETSEVIKHILQHEGRYAIIGLPCVCKAIRLAMQLNPKLQRRVRFVLGLVCGQTKSKFFVEYVCALGGGDPHCLKQVTFRIKDPNRPASEFGMKWVCNDEMNPRREGVVFWTDGMNRIWFDRYFTLNACNFCDDIFAELSDACFMDAWLSPYRNDNRGHTIILIRNRDLLNLIENPDSEKALQISHLPIEQVIRSQIGVIFEKRKAISERLAHCDRAGLAAPAKRVNKNTKLRCDSRLEIRTRLIISQRSPDIWLKCGKRLREFHRTMFLPRGTLVFIKWCRGFIKKINSWVPIFTSR